MNKRQSNPNPNPARRASNAYAGSQMPPDIPKIHRAEITRLEAARGRWLWLFERNGHPARNYTAACWTTPKQFSGEEMADGLRSAEEAIRAVWLKHP